jgi:gamma-glutamyltranspeptidase/glutathione hydrolase
LGLESRFGPDVVAELSAAGHEDELVPGFSDVMGDSGGPLCHSKGVIEAAGDPRSDGLALG